MKTRKLGSGEFTHYDLEGWGKDDRKRKEEPLEEANLMVRVSVCWVIAGQIETSRDTRRGRRTRRVVSSGEVRRVK